MEDCYLRIEKEFWTARGRKTIYPAGRNLFYEVETMSSVDIGEIREYYVYDYPNVHLGLYDEEEFNEIFMTKDEIRDKKIDEII
jgi:hypothetical protein